MYQPTPLRCLKRFHDTFISDGVGSVACSRRNDRRTGRRSRRSLTASTSRRSPTGDRAGMVYWRIEAGATLPVHAHDNEQIGFVLEGNSPQSSRARSPLTAGDAYRFASSERHGAENRAREDAFGLGGPRAPPREEPGGGRRRRPRGSIVPEGSPLVANSLEAERCGPLQSILARGRSTLLPRLASCPLPWYFPTWTLSITSTSTSTRSSPVTSFTAMSSISNWSDRPTISRVHTRCFGAGETVVTLAETGRAENWDERGLDHPLDKAHLAFATDRGPYESLMADLEGQFPEARTLRLGSSRALLPRPGRQPPRGHHVRFTRRRTNAPVADARRCRVTSGCTPR